MSFLDEFRDPELVHNLADRIHARSSRPLTFMEVCGTHTMAISRFGVRALLPENVRLISGPGCPVCVTGVEFIDQACAISRQPDTIVTTFGDLIRVPGSESSLERERAAGADIRIVQSSLEALGVATDNPGRTVIFLGVGFETTAPTTAAALVQAATEGMTNFQVLSAHKLMKPAMLALADGEVRLDGYICPGHVSVVTGAGMYSEIVEKCGIGCVVAGFEPVDILRAILMLVEQAERGEPAVENAYARVVSWGGVAQAQHLIEDVFTPEDTVWRGLGVIPGSGLAIGDEYRRFDAAATYQLDLPEPREPPGCRCGDVLRGACTPDECPLYGESCTPESPIGACMVSSEGTCAAYFRYAEE